MVHGCELNFKFLFTLILITASCAHPSPQDSCSFIKNQYNERISWKDEVPVNIFLHDSFPLEYRDAVEYAIRSWNKKAGKTILQLNDRIISGSINPTVDKLNIIYYETSYSRDTNEQAFTNLKWSGDKIKDADIIINAKDFKFYTRDNPIRNAVSLETLLVHELGHLLGLDHVKDSGQVMYPWLPTNTDKSGLETFDPKILKCEY